MSIPPTTSQVPGPASQVRSLEKSHQELRVLRGVDFEVTRGGIFALFGSNGAGKTTIVRILSTLLNADAGTPLDPVRPADGCWVMAFRCSMTCDHHAMGRPAASAAAIDDVSVKT